MPWNSICPLGSVSVKNNRTRIQDNMTYIETNMGNSIVGTNTNTTRDHFWNVGANEDGRHRFMNSPAFTVGGNPADPVVGTGMDGILYLKSDGLTPATVQGFYRNASTIYQYIPSFKSGTFHVTSSFTSITTVPNNCYGEIYMFRIEGEFGGQVGFFKAQGGTCQAWSYGLRIQGNGNARYNIKFGNGADAFGLNIWAVADSADPEEDWQYRIIYRAI